MKLSFSTKGWHNKSFEEFCNIARELKFGGIELHNINGELFKNKDGAFHGYAAAATVSHTKSFALRFSFFPRATANTSVFFWIYKHIF